MRRFAAIILVLGMTGVSADAAHADGLAATAQTAISRYRAEHGLAAVTADPRLMALAAEQARAMAKAGVLEHEVDRPFQMRIVRYDPSVAVENIAGGTKDFSSTLELWKHSAGHDANLRKAGVTRFGIASAASPDSKYKIFWALILAGSDAHHGLRQAGGSGIMRAAPGAGPRVRVVRSHERPPDLMAGVKRLLRPLWQSGSAKDK